MGKSKESLHEVKKPMKSCKVCTKHKSEIELNDEMAMYGHSVTYENGKYFLTKSFQGEVCKVELQRCPLCNRGLFEPENAVVSERDKKGVMCFKEDVKLVLDRFEGVTYESEMEFSKSEEWRLILELARKYAYTMDISKVELVKGVLETLHLIKNGGKYNVLE